jgi:hypothetical protein
MRSAFQLFIELGSSVGGLIVMMDTENMLALDKAGRILRTNLFFSGWASLITSVALLVGYGHEVNAATMESTNASHAGYWVGICMASVVACASSIQMLFNGVSLQGEYFDCRLAGERPDAFCKRLKFSISLGAISTCVAGVCSLFSFKMSIAVNASASFVMLFAWAWGVAFVTFGDMSPGNEVGNLYFSCWASFVFSLFMVSTSIKDFLIHRDETADEEAVKSETPRNLSSDQAVQKEDKVEATSLPKSTMTPNSITIPVSNEPEVDAMFPSESSDESADPTLPFSNMAFPTRSRSDP